MYDDLSTRKAAAHAYGVRSPSVLHREGTGHSCNAEENLPSFYRPNRWWRGAVDWCWICKYRQHPPARGVQRPISPAIPPPTILRPLFQPPPRTRMIGGEGSRGFPRLLLLRQRRAYPLPRNVEIPSQHRRRRPPEKSSKIAFFQHSSSPDSWPRSRKTRFPAHSGADGLR